MVSGSKDFPRLTLPSLLMLAAIERVAGSGRPPIAETLAYERGLTYWGARASFGRLSERGLVFTTTDGQYFLTGKGGRVLDDWRDAERRTAPEGRSERLTADRSEPYTAPLERRSTGPESTSGRYGPLRRGIRVSSAANAQPRLIWVFSQTGDVLHALGSDETPICGNYRGHYIPVADAFDPSSLDSFPRCNRCCALTGTPPGDGPDAALVRAPA